MDAEQFSLKWNNFHSNLSSGFHQLLQGEDLIDVTFAVDGKFLHAHKLVLSVCSPYFKKMFKIHPDKHPIVILKGVGYNDLSDIFQFMYQGEVNVRQENLANFLKTAEFLQVKGLTDDDAMNEDMLGQSSQPYKSSTRFDPAANPHFVKRDVSTECITTTNSSQSPIPQAKPTSSNRKTNISHTSFEEVPSKRQRSVSIEEQPDNSNPTPKIEPVYLEDDYDSSSGIGEFHHLLDNNDTPSMAQMPSNLLHDTSQPDLHGCKSKWIKSLFDCSQCSKSFSRRDHLRTHMKNIHGEHKGPFACGICSKLYKNAESLRKHIAKYHNSQYKPSLLNFHANVM